MIDGAIYRDIARLYYALRSEGLFSSRTRLEVVEQISIGTTANGYLDMVTTPTGVGFKWRS